MQHAHAPPDVRIEDANLSVRLRGKLDDNRITNLSEVLNDDAETWHRRLRAPLFRELQEVLAEHHMTFN